MLRIKTRLPLISLMTLVTILSSLIPGTLASVGTNQIAAAAANTSWTLIGPGDADWTTVMAVDNNGVVYAGFDIGGFYKSSDHGNSWSPINNGISNYYAYDITSDPNNSNTLWAATRGGIFKSTNSGASWSAKRNGIGGPSSGSITAPISSVVVDPHNSQIVYAGVGDTRRWRDGHGTIFKSTNGGDSWSPFSIGSSSNIVTRLAIDPNNPSTLYAASTEGLFKSSNSGQSWSKKLSNTSSFDVKVSPSNPSILYSTVGSGGVQKSTDFGENWSSASGSLNLSSATYHWLTIHPSNPNIVYVSNYTYNSSNGVWKTTNGGSSWSKSTVWGFPTGGNVSYGWRPQYSMMGNTVAIDPSNPSRVYMGSTSQIIKSEDSGSSWQQIYTAKTSNGWTNRGLNVLGASRVTTVDPNNPNRIYVGTGDHGILKSDDAGSTWRLVSNGTGMKNGFDSPAIVVDPSNSALVWASDNAVLSTNSGGMAKSSNYGESWSQINSGLPDAHINSLVLDPNSSSSSRTLFAVSEGNGVYKSTNGGSSWSKTSSGLPANNIIQLIMSPSNSQILYAAVEGSSSSPGGVWKTTNGGSSWSKANSNTTLVNVRSIAVNPSNSGVLYAGVRQSGSYGGGVYKSSDAGSNWTRVLSDVRIEAVVALPANSNVVYAATQDDNYHDESSGRGVYRSGDGGNTWNLVNNGLAVLRFWTLNVAPQAPYEVYAGSNGSGVYVTIDPAFGGSTTPPPPLPSPVPTTPPPPSPTPAPPDSLSSFLPVILDNAFGGWSTGISIQNTSSNPTSVTIDYFDSSGLLKTRDSFSIGSHDYLAVSQAGHLGSGFAGSAIVYSNQPLAIAVNEVSSKGQAMSYRGVNQSSNNLYAPVVLSNAYGDWSTGIGIQNTSSNPTSVTIDYFNSNGSKVKQQSQTIPPKGSWAVYQGGLLPIGFAGSAVINSNQPIVAVVNETSPSSDAMSYNTLTSGNTAHYLPEIHDNANGWTTGIGIQNTSSNPTSVSIDYYDANGLKVTTDSHTIPAKGYWGAYQGGRLGQGFSGSAVVHSVQDTTVLVNDISPSKGAKNYDGYGTGATTNYLPAILYNAYGGWTTSISLQNASANSSNITINYYDPNGKLINQQTNTLAGRGSWTVSQGAIGLPSGFTGSAIISSSQPGVAIANEIKPTSSSTGSAMSYNAITP